MQLRTWQNYNTITTSKRCISVNAYEREPCHIALSSDLNLYGAILNYLKDNRSYFGNHGDTELLRDNIKCIEKMTGIHISEDMKEGKTPEQLIRELDESLSKQKTMGISTRTEQTEV